MHRSVGRRVAGYRYKFETPQEARQYDDVEYAPTGYPAILWETEKRLLLEELRRLRSRCARIDYLDFACGSGRALAFVEPYVNSATGVDVSESMLEIARSKVTRAHLLCADITADGSSIDCKYDLITAFRFLLNSSSSLRRAALKALAGRLRNRESRLILNNHGSLYSHKLIAWPYHRFRQLLGHLAPSYLVHSEIASAIANAELEIVAIHGYGLLGAKALNLLTPRQLQKLEDAFADMPVIRKIGVNQMYVARLRL